MVQFIDADDVQIRGAVAVRDGAAASARLPPRAAPGDRVLLVPNGGGMAVQGAFVNGVAGGKPCFRGEAVVALTDGGSGYATGDTVQISNGTATLAATVQAPLGAITAVTSELRTDAFGPGDTLTVDASGSGDGNAVLTAAARGPNACVSCVHSSGGKWLCRAHASDGSARPL